ncbi:MAG TPA: glycosyltransferase family 4 protein [Acetobacteraceae bacterium]|jgi:glycosyltransferase involved in cell wall biosynthesis|nr:glycosyltransferase family 4 protein [Acetobacteraceae bacterium]
MDAGVSNTAVLQVLPSLVTGGVERGTVEITRAIAKAGGIALVASAGGRMVTAVQRAGGRHVTLPLDSKNPLTIWRNAALLADVIRTERVAIVHARSRAPAWSAWLACGRTGAHFVTTYHGAYGEDLPFKRHYNAVMAKGERVIAASRFIAELIVARHRTDPARIRVIPRGVDLAVFDPDAVSGEQIARLERAWRLPDGAPVVLLPGRLTRWKGQAVLIEALCRLARRDVCCVLVGSDQGRRRYAAQLIRQAEALGVADRLRLAGECDDMPAALMLADVVVHASTEPEAFGRVVIEAQAMGRPVIASDLGGPVETVEHGVTGWRVPPGDAGALASAIDHALTLSTSARAEAGFGARAAVQLGYTVAAMQAATLAVYDELLVGVAAVAA